MTKKLNKLLHANPQKNRTPRHRSRELVLQGMYQWLITQEDIWAINANMRLAHAFDRADAQYFDTLLAGATQKATLLRIDISPFLHRPIADLSPIEHAVLLMAAFELKHHPEVPYRVVINEAVELAKSFGGTDGHKYVNGVLHRLAVTLRQVEVANPI